ncbi:acyl carrier protein [Streptomyces capoamus]|uniref:acyl carrier protein n=1 Tax=Streptomyces capoamus TaxID=68183 RepID=UPI00339A498C
MTELPSTELPSATATGTDLDGDPVEVVEAVWARALDMETIDPDDGFFDLGATSTMIVDVVRVLRGRWPDLRIVDVFAHATVRQLAAFLGDG